MLQLVLHAVSNVNQSSYWRYEDTKFGFYFGCMNLTIARRTINMLQEEFVRRGFNSTVAPVTDRNEIFKSFYDYVW